MQDLINDSFNEALESLRIFMDSSENMQMIEKAATAIATAIQQGNKVISCGNGGSLCEATHFAEELTGRYRINRNPFPAIALNDPSHITCVGNDYSFDEIFSRYVEAVAQRGDVLIAISTSGNSRNILNAVEAAHKKGVSVIGMTCNSDNLLRKTADFPICAPKNKYSDRIQEIHIKVIHIMIQVIERKLSINN